MTDPARGPLGCRMRRREMLSLGRFTSGNQQRLCLISQSSQISSYRSSGMSPKISVLRSYPSLRMQCTRATKTALRRVKRPLQSRHFGSLILPRNVVAGLASKPCGESPASAGLFRVRQIRLGPNVRFRAVFFCCTPSFGRGWSPVPTESFDPEPSYGSS